MEENRHLKIVELCLSTLGQNEFIDHFLTLIKKIGAVQSTIFSFNEEKPVCLLSRNLEVSLVGEMVTAIYLSGWYKSDPLNREIRLLPEGALVIRHIADMTDDYPDDYKQAFYSLFKEKNPKIGLADRMSILLVGNKLRLIVQIYFTHTNSPHKNNPLLPILGHLALQHFEMAEETASKDFPIVLTSLSDRERQVCLGILSGKKAELIAADMEVAPSTVVTYRRRAYEKLGISSRSALFEICGN
ncbi:helix-turn-helix transcriptional regulator [uncultured Cohaesibacter sp.]|uniref:helix-turn-helix transcriptional regulator n=1 Tax=uncultured Cohaesibacter sp. TaxID=1002546 RepID=UPI00292DAAFB|nr:helix-turn-helix transcriptional regulator [uncultured Cohaesibacter sp.]